MAAPTAPKLNTRHSRRSPERLMRAAAAVAVMGMLGARHVRKNLQVSVVIRYISAAPRPLGPDSEASMPAHGLQHGRQPFTIGCTSCWRPQHVALPGEFSTRKRTTDSTCLRPSDALARGIGQLGASETYADIIALQTAKGSPGAQALTYPEAVWIISGGSVPIAPKRLGAYISRAADILTQRHVEKARAWLTTTPAQTTWDF